MSESEIISQLTDTFILAKGNSTHLFEKLTREIECIHGHIRHAFPPKVIFASIPTSKIKDLIGCSVVEFLTTDEINIPPPLLSADEFLDLISIWNVRIKANRETSQKTSTSENLSWDAPGHLPPDPPPQFKKMIHEWEKNLEKST